MKKILMTLTLALAVAIAIPAAAQSTTTTETQQTKECCKQKKECQKECSNEAGKACANPEGKCKKGSKGPKGMHKAQARKQGNPGRMVKGRRMVGETKESRMKRMNHGDRYPLMKGITLTPEQQQKMNALRDKNIAAKKKSKADAEVKSKEEMEKLRADFDKEVEKILDKEQLKQYKANKAEMEARRAEKMQSKRPGLEKKDK